MTTIQPLVMQSEFTAYTDVSVHSDDTEADEPHDGGGDGLDDDFDFSRGLASFDKQQVFREIRVSTKIKQQGAER